MAESPSGQSAEAGSAAVDPEPAGRRRPLNREVIFAAALRVVDDHGLDALTMRRLGRELDRDPMSLYRHAIDRAALLDGVAEFVLDQLVIPDSDGGWRAQLRRTANDFRDLCLEHPNVVPLLVTRPPATPLGRRPIGTLRPLEQVLAVLIDAGFAPVTALRIYRAYFALLYGYVLNELQETVIDRRGIQRPPPPRSTPAPAHRFHPHPEPGNRTRRPQRRRRTGIRP